MQNKNISKVKIYHPNIDEYIYISTGEIANKANGSVILECGNMVMLATVVASKEINLENNFLNLSVDYQERFSATGRIPGGFYKRESKLSNYEILISRLVDRALRPRFPSDYYYDIHINIILLSGDKLIAPDCLACLAASSALTISDIPFNGPISEVRVVLYKNEFIVNPLINNDNKYELDIIIAASIEDIIMIEGNMQECSITKIMEAVNKGHNIIKQHINTQNILLSNVKTATKQLYKKPIFDQKFYNDMYKSLYSKIVNIFESCHSIDIKKGFLEKLYDQYIIDINHTNTSYSTYDIKKYYKKVTKYIIRKLILNKKIRLDGRKYDNIRNINSKINILPSTHGSSIFTRGETQVISTVTLGSKYDEQCIDGAMFSGYDNFILHYNFPGFATGEIKPNRQPSRREIGHGNLALKAIKPVLLDNFSYTIRIVADVLSSNGSSSMATVCATTLALLDAGIKIKNSVAGIAMGLIQDENNNENYVILSDITGEEDQIGDMDLKLTGTNEGITAIQIDIKTNALSQKILYEGLTQAYKGILYILESMNTTINTPKNSYKEHAPRIFSKVIDSKLVGIIIGTGGKTINEIQRNTNTLIKIVEKNKQNILEIFAPNKQDLDNAIQILNGYIILPKIGTIYNGIVKNILKFGAFIEFMPGKEGLLHISEISNDHINDINDLLSIGQKLKIKLIDIDKKTGKFRLSIKRINIE